MPHRYPRMHDGQWRLILTTLWLSAMTSCTSAPQAPPMEQATHPSHILQQGEIEREIGWWPAIAMDTSGNLHASYCDLAKGDLVYSHQKQGSWHHERLATEGAVGKYSQIVVGKYAGQTRVAIAYHDETQHELRVLISNAFNGQAKKGTWANERLAYGTEVGMASKLLFDTAGALHFFYYVPENERSGASTFYHARRMGPNQWSKHKVADAHATYSASIDAVPTTKDGEFWVSFLHWKVSTTALKLARSQLNTEGQHQSSVETITSGAGHGWHSFIQRAEAPSQKPTLFFTEFKKGALNRADYHSDKKRWEWQPILYGVGNLKGVQFKQTPIFIYEDISGSGRNSGLLSLYRYDAQPAQRKRIRISPQAASGTYMHPTLSQGRLSIIYYSASDFALKVYEQEVL